MQRGVLPASGKTLHRVDRLCRYDALRIKPKLRDLSSLSLSPQKGDSASRKQSKREVPCSTQLRPKRRRLAHLPIHAASLAAEIEEEADVDELKAQLLDSFYGIERGLQASTEVRAEISELITRLEAHNPTPSPNEAVSLLSGKWKLVYTANSELAPLLALGRIPGVTVGDIEQNIYSMNKIENKVSFVGPFFRSSFSTTANIDVTSPKRLQVTFQEGRIGTPQLLQGIEFPDSTFVLGQYVDLRNLKDALQPVNAAVKDAAETLSEISERSSDLRFPIRGQQAQSWLLNTFLDSDLRISRGDRGSLFVLVKGY